MENIMAKIIKELTLDVVRDNDGCTVAARQNDVGSRFIRAYITADRHRVELDKSMGAVINACRPDGEKNGFVGEIDVDGAVTVPISPWMLKVFGSVKCDISIFDGSERLTTMPFYVSVEESLYDGEGIEAEEEYTLLSSLIEELQEIRGAEEERVYAETVRENAEAVRETNEAVRISAENERDNAEGVRELSEGARENAEALRVLSESVRTTFIPKVSEDGFLSWTNDKGLENPEPVSVKPRLGTDYFTEGDKAEIVERVLNALPHAEGGAF